MHEVTYRFDEATSESIKELCSHYNSNSAGIIKKSLALLKLAAFVEQTEGEMIIRKGNHETKLMMK